MSKLRCRVGDIALVIPAPNAGKVVRVVSRLTDDPDGREWFVESLGGKLRNADDARRRAMAGNCHDNALVPLRGGKGEDEVLRIVGKPEDVHA
jgi:hypothetical protein